MQAMKTIYVDIDGTICTIHDDYNKAEPIVKNIDKINNLYNRGNYIKYWTARGTCTGIDWYSTTEQQLKDWGCKYNELSVGEKPAYDLIICDKSKRIEDI